MISVEGNYKICNFCIMDDSVPDIEFNEKGECNFCTNHRTRIANEKDQYSQNQLDKLCARIKKNKKKNYDCIIGVSGGVDSTYTAYIVKKILKLNPLAIHFDNGWNSELAVDNIKNCLEKLDIDLYTYVVDWNEFKNIQKSLIYSSIKNIEIATDHAIQSLLFKTASREKIKFILHGGNNATEGIMPSSWMENNHDKKLIASIAKKFTNQKLKSLPTMNLFEFFYYLILKRIKYIPILNFFDYEKDDVLKILENELGYRPYKFKHYESVITRFFQGYILPNKFNIDKRKAHFSNLILSKQLTREEGLNLLKEPIYNENDLNTDLDFFIKKLDLTEQEFERIMNEQLKKRYRLPIKY